MPTNKSNNEILADRLGEVPEIYIQLKSILKNREMDRVICENIFVEHGALSPFVEMRLTVKIPKDIMGYLYNGD